jgi:sugar lactone lactonase YvrE
MSGINLVRLGTSPSGASYFIGLITGAAQQNGNSVNIDSSNNFILGSASYNAANAFFFETIKLSPVGAISWQRQLGDNIAGRDSSNSSAVIDSSGNIYAAGYSADNFTTPAGCIAKYNSSGTIQWQVTLVNAEMFWNGIALDSVNSFLYAVGTYRYTEWIIAKYNLTGVLQWQINISVTSAGGNGIVLDSSGNVYVTGKTSGVQPQYTTIVKLNSSGVIQWQTRLGSSTGYGITLDSSNNVYVAGCTGSAGIGLISKHNSAGVFQWARTLGTAGLTTVIFYSVTLDSAGNIYV